MKRSDFYYELPPELIASQPAVQRSDSRLMHVDISSGTISHHRFSEFPSLLSNQDLLVFNDTRVIPARFLGRKSTGGKVEILLERITSDFTAKALIRSSKPLRKGAEIILSADLPPVTVEGRQGQFYLLSFPLPGVSSIAGSLGQVPLPPYIDRAATAVDVERYQTVFARHDGAVAAPTAGLHFDYGMLEKLDRKGLQREAVTLHVGAGTFQPVRVEDIETHDMHSEWLQVSEQSCAAIAQCRARNGAVVAVGTTSARALEAASSSGIASAFQGDTRIFIYPGYRFRSVDSLLTNFHLPESTLLMLVSAFAGSKLIKEAYRQAIDQKYRFFSYGDAMLLSNEYTVR
ncbi:MAG TPA: tRNA preQ1(34) S-adenosylmethionine ribosyltransferase-isomerase QueA [Gammaproteobacteria bacterium]|nr:tRNA preQ1(34) S-adenosylmethionine ribosyltransferase-isomerase QueA [Gammaproteobacteria bacterium]